MKSKDKVLKFLKKQKKCTRIEVAKELGISQAAVSKLVKSMMSEGYILEEGKKISPHSGRCSSYLRLNPDFGRVIGIYYGFDDVKISLGDLSGKILKKFRLEIKRPEDILGKTIKILDTLTTQEKIVGIGIGMNGIVNSEKGISVKATYYNWSNINLKESLEKKYRVPVSVENGANLLAIYEKENGVAKENDNFIIINIENGVGAAIFLNGHLHKGKYYDIGEIGHTPFDYSNNALICNCGNKGCIETLLANWIIEKKVFEATGKKYSYSEIVNLANEGERTYIEIILGTILPLSHIIIWITSLLSFEKIIISGKVTKCKPYFMEALKSQMKKNILNKEKVINVVKSDYNKNKILEGAMLLIVNDIFNKNLLGGKNSE